MRYRDYTLSESEVAILIDALHYASNAIELDHDERTTVLALTDRLSAWEREDVLDPKWTDD